LHEIYTMPKVTQKLIDTASVDVVQWLIAKSGESFALKEGTAFHTGDGVAKPRGFLSYPTASTGDATRPWGTIQYIATTSSGAFPASSTTVNPADVLVNVQSALKAQYRAGAVWLMNRTTAGVARKLKDAEGRHVWVDSLVQGQPSLLLGHPVEVDEDMPDIGADQFAIAFGNLAQAYTIVEQPGVRFLADPYTAKPHVRLFSYRRVGGAVSNSEAIKLLKFGTT
jgi:HK97 family phage major capsid protein